MDDYEPLFKLEPSPPDQYYVFQSSTDTIVISEDDAKREPGFHPGSDFQHLTVCGIEYSITRLDKYGR